jgi:hypothetical protein
LMGQAWLVARAELAGRAGLAGRAELAGRAGLASRGGLAGRAGAGFVINRLVSLHRHQSVDHGGRT